MTNKVDIKRLDSVTSNDTTATALINENFQNIQTAIENTLSRNGQTPNYMQNILDMNSYRIINTAAPTDDLDVVNKGYLDSFIGDINQKVTAVEEAAQAALEKANNAASSAASSAQYAQTAVNAAAAAAADAVTSAQAARDIEGYLEDPNLVAVGTDLRKGDNSLIAQAVDAAATILSTDYAEDLSFSNNKLQLLDQNGDALGNYVEFAKVASTGAYNDLIGKPTIPTVNNATITFTQGGVSKGSFTVNTATDATIALDAGGGGSSLPDQTGHSGDFLTTDGTDASWQTLNIPTDTSDLTNGAGFITSSDLSGYQTTANLVTSVDSSSTDSQYPSAKLFYDTCGDIETLINAL